MPFLFCLKTEEATPESWQLGVAGVCILVKL